MKRLFCAIIVAYLLFAPAALALDASFSIDTTMAMLEQQGILQDGKLNWDKLCEVENSTGSIGACLLTDLLKSDILDEKYLLVENTALDTFEAASIRDVLANADLDNVWVSHRYDPNDSYSSFIWNWGLQNGMEKHYFWLNINSDLQESYFFLAYLFDSDTIQESCRRLQRHVEKNGDSYAYFHIPEGVIANALQSLT